MAIKLGDAIIAVQANTKQFNADLLAVENRAKQTSQNMAAGFRTAGLAMTALGAGIIGALGASVKTAIEFETAMTGVRKTTNLTDAEFAQMSAQIKDLATVIPLTTTELALLAEIGGQMGVPKQHLIDFTTTMAHLQATTDLAGEAGAKMLARFMNVTNLPWEQFQNLGSVIAYLGNNAEGSEQEILMLGQRISAAGTLAGLTVSEVLGLSAALVGVGITSEKGGTAISKFFNLMKKSVIMGGEDLETFAAIAGVTSDKFVTAFRDNPAQAFVLFVNGLQKIEAQGGSVAAAMQALGLNGERVIDVFGSMTLTGNKVEEQMNAATAAFGRNADLLKEAALRYGTTESQMIMFNNSVKNLRESIGSGLIPVLTKMMEKLKPLIGDMADFADKNEDATANVTLFAAALGGLLLIVGPLLFGVNQLITFLGSMKAVLLFIAGIKFSSLLGVLGSIVAFITAPLTLAFIAAGLAIVGVATAIYDEWENFWKLCTDFGLWIVDFFEKVWELMTGDFEGFFTFVWNSIMSLIDLFRLWLSEIPLLGPLLNKLFPNTFPTSIEQLASGTNYAPGGMALVGERGPELVELPRGSKVHTARETAGMAMGNNFNAPLINIQNVNASNPADVDGFIHMIDKKLGEVLRRTSVSKGRPIGSFA